MEGHPPQDRPPTTPAARSPPQGIQATVTVQGPQAHRPAPTASGWRTPTARPEAGQLGQDKRLASDAPHNGAGHPPRGRPPATPTARRADSQEHTLWGRCWAPHAHTTRGRDTRATGPGCSPPGTGGQERDSARHHTPLTTVEGRPPRDGHQPPRQHAAPEQGMQAQEIVTGPHARTLAPTACGERTSTDLLEDGQPAEGGRLTSHAPRNGARHPPRGSPPATPTARNAGSQKGTLWGRCWAPHAHTTLARNTRAAGPGRPPGRTGGRGRDSA